MQDLIVCVGWGCFGGNCTLQLNVVNRQTDRQNFIQRGTPLSKLDLILC